MSWSSLGLSSTTDDLILSEFGFSSPVPIQSQTVPLALANKDVVVISPTGSGKTLAYLLPLHHFFNSSPDQFASIIILPTRELAIQVHEVAIKLFPPSHLSLLCKDSDSLPSSSTILIIGTPGSILRFLSTSPLFSRKVSHLVLDEVDRLLDRGEMLETTKKVISHLPKHRRTLFFSATLDESRRDTWIKHCGLRNPEIIEPQTHTTLVLDSSYQVPVSLSNEVWIIKEENRIGHLFELIFTSKFQKIIVFLSTRFFVDFLYVVTPLLQSINSDYQSISWSFLHGKMSSSKRSKMMAEFGAQTGRKSVLVSTDLVSRGLDIDSVDLVVQLEAPLDPTSFVHRAGRSARMGKSGTNVLLLSPHEDAFVNYLHNKGLSLTTKIVDSCSLNLFTELRNLAQNNQHLHDLGKRTFVATIRAYSEHKLGFIFRKRKFDFVGRATCLGLLHVPRCPETRGVVHEYEKLTPNFEVRSTKEEGEKGEGSKEKKERNVRGEQQDDLPTPTSTSLPVSSKHCFAPQLAELNGHDIDTTRLQELIKMRKSSDRIEEELMSIEESINRKFKKKKISEDLFDELSDLLAELSANIRKDFFQTFSGENNNKARKRRSGGNQGGSKKGKR
ncbi:hypothetical protein RCL1_007578 [Eukaryota sp. TZLM3-RCL]